MYTVKTLRTAALYYSKQKRAMKKKTSTNGYLHHQQNYSSFF